MKLAELLQVAGTCVGTFTSIVMVIERGIIKRIRDAGATAEAWELKI